MGNPLQTIFNNFIYICVYLFIGQTCCEDNTVKKKEPF